MIKSQPANVVELLQSMVRHNSVSSAISGRPKAEATLGDHLVRCAKWFDLPVKRMPVDGRADQLLVTHEVDPAAPWLLFDSHMDTVAVDGMTVEPFGGEVRSGRVYGRGSCDTKGTGAAMLWAMQQYAKSEQRGNNVALYFGVDEEAGMHGVSSFLKRDYPALGFTPKGVIVGEPTELHPVVAHNGVVRWRVHTKGLAAHSSVPHEGRSAISMMMKLLTAIEHEYIPSLKAEHELTGPAACSVNMIQGGCSPNIIPDHCVIDVDRRVVPGEDVTKILAEFVAVLDAARGEDTSLAYNVDVGTGCPPLLGTGNAALTAFIRQVLADHALPTMLLGAPYGTHAGHYANAGLPAVVFGPGEIDRAHTRDESIGIEQLERGVEVYLTLMQRTIG